ncbi:NYN domain-containing protein [Paradevosia shaoguanensis]|uniref:NYN domain-containing protein n=1 Tax=Paradevosia shaoguanensis TaxID=1335043 RepID=A0AA41UF67_9HYPH|nr:NYN domain-containing protein [Paradevosia shaoguanensis]MCF1744741.1 NYN domain-containing protein [Paradevosia shaoguanensis]MCI0129224.1 NYN domain-containing protein [Paradevosia shaoguanensis]
MSKKKIMSKAPAKQGKAIERTARAPAHKPLVNDNVHVFVDDQNLFWDIVNSGAGKGFRIDIGLLTLAACKDTAGKARFIASAYVAGVIPDDDYFWEVWKQHNFVVNRGFLGHGNRSKQDDAFLIRDMTKTICREAGPSTIVLIAGDADYGPPLEFAVEEGWRVEVFTTGRGVSAALERYAHEFRVVDEEQIRLMR